MNFADNKLAGASPGPPTESSGSPAPISRAFSCAPTPGPALIAAAVSAVPLTNNELFKQFKQAYLAAQARG